MENKKITLYFKIGNQILFSVLGALLLSYTLLSSYFKVEEPKYRIEIQGTAEKNKKAQGSDIRIRALKLDGEVIAFDQMEVGEGWGDLDGLLVSMNPQTPVSIRILTDHAKVLELDLQKHTGSGILKIFVNDRQIGNLDLYSKNWKEIGFRKDIRKTSVTSNMVLFLLLCGFLFAMIKACGRLAEAANHNSLVRKRLMVCLLGVGVMFVMILTWFQMEASSGYQYPFQFVEMEPVYIWLNIWTNGVIIALIYVLINRIWLSCLLYGIFSFLVSVVNHYTIKLHGSPLSVLELKNFKTALNVIGSYKISLDFISVFLIILLILCLLICFTIKKLELSVPFPAKSKWIRKAGILAISMGVLYLGYFAPYSIKPSNTIGWLWNESYHKYGYMASSLELLFKWGHGADKPEGYSTEKIEGMEIPKNRSVSGTKPDVILILNETFYDMRTITDVKTDVPFLSYIDEMDGVIKGFTVVPSVGGGTNASEYELLTSNSLQLMKGITPFNVLDLSDANSIVSHMKKLGYKTLGAHSESAQNYGRGRVYPDLGFEQTYFEGDFSDREYYGNRNYYETDESLYRNLRSWYEEDQGESPKFYYLLTIQNHGGWDENPPEEDTVHALNDYGQHQQELNEFLSCIKKSDEAFWELTNYFKDVNRPVVVCMVGDHSPWFADQMVEEGFSQEESMIRLRGTPFVIWSNYGLAEEDTGYISMNYLAPLLLRAARLETSPYYDYMIELAKRVPVLTVYDRYRDIFGGEYSYGEQTEYKNQVDGYFDLEYNNLQKKRIQSMFDPNDS